MEEKKEEEKAETKKETKPIGKDSIIVCTVLLIVGFLLFSSSFDTGDNAAKVVGGIGGVMFFFGIIMLCGIIATINNYLKFLIKELKLLKEKTNEKTDRQTDEKMN